MTKPRCIGLNNWAGRRSIPSNLVRALRWRLQNFASLCAKIAGRKSEPTCSPLRAQVRARAGMANDETARVLNEVWEICAVAEAG